MSVPQEHIQASKSLIVSDDTEDNDLSDISERSNEEDNFDSIDNKNLQPIVHEARYDKRDMPYSKVLTSDVYTSEIEPSHTEKQSSPSKELNNMQELSTSNSNVDKQPETLSTTPRSVVPARRLRQSSSEHSTSDADFQIDNHSAEGLFYSPDESTDDGEESDNRQLILNSTSVKNEISESLNQYQQANNSDEDGDEQDFNRSNSTESEETPVPSKNMVLGEPLMHNQLGCMRFCTNTDCICSVSYFQAFLLNINDIITSYSIYKHHFSFLFII